MRQSRFKPALAALFCIALVLPARARAQVTAGECCLDMLAPLSARVVGLGQAITARAGTDGVYVNPAALMQSAKSELIFGRTTVNDASASTITVLVRSRVAGIFGLTYSVLEYDADESTDETGGIGIIQPIHTMIVASYATAIGLGWSGGVNYRLYHAGGPCTVATTCATLKSSSTAMLDAGLRYVPPFLSRLNLGASVMHLGFPLQVNNAAQANPTPVRVRVGAAYDVSSLFGADSTIAVWLSADLVQRIHDAAAPAPNVGVEVILDNMIYLRGGYASETAGINSGGAGVGLGVKYQRFDINIAKSAASGAVFPAPVYVSFGISF